LNLSRTTHVHYYTALHDLERVEPDERLDVDRDEEVAERARAALLLAVGGIDVPRERERNDAMSWCITTRHTTPHRAMSRPRTARAAPR
jgi:hypothetical protein